MADRSKSHASAVMTPASSPTKSVASSSSPSHAAAVTVNTPTKPPPSETCFVNALLSLSRAEALRVVGDALKTACLGGENVHELEGEGRGVERVRGSEAGGGGKKEARVKRRGGGETEGEVEEGGGNFKLEFIFDNFIFALQRGFALSEALSLVPLTRLLLDSACAGSPRTQTLRLFRDEAAKLVVTNRIKKIHLEKFSPQFVDDLLRHYRLFHFVNTQPRPPFEAHMRVTVTAPKPPPPLSLAKPLAVWTYDNKWNEIQNREDRETTRRETEKVQFAEETAQRMRKVEGQVLETVMEAPSFKDKNTLEHVVKDIADIHIDHLVGNMRLQVNDIVEKLSFKLEKTLLPRPQVLGPPPRYSPSPLPPAPRPTKEPKGAPPSAAQDAGKAPAGPKASAKNAPKKKK